MSFLTLTSSVWMHFKDLWKMYIDKVASACQIEIKKKCYFRAFLWILPTAWSRQYS